MSPLTNADTSDGPKSGTNTGSMNETWRYYLQDDATSGSRAAATAAAFSRNSALAFSFARRDLRNYFHTLDAPFAISTETCDRS